MGLMPMPTNGPMGTSAAASPTSMPLPTDQGAPTAGPAASQDDQVPNVSPEEQAEYETFVTKASDIIHGGKSEKVMPEILQALQPAKEGATDKGNPAVLALAQTAVSVVQKLDDAATQAGTPISDDVLYHGTTEVLGMLGDIAQAAGIHDYTEDEMGGAMFQAIDLYRPIAIETGRTSEETLKGQFGEVVQADEAGKLGDVLPGAGGTTVGAAPVAPAQGDPGAAQP